VQGIGFKSVFRVTDAPQVHSNGFHVTFDITRHKALGYILPTWVPLASSFCHQCKMPRPVACPSTVRSCKLQLREAQQLLRAVQCLQVDR
jgi:hypothetical protein